jgi:ABC-2 type transport system ATP-binding protein
MEIVLEAKQLTKHYQDKQALNNLNLQLAAGEIFSLLGPNGAGKSTTIHLFLGFITPTTGAAYINGMEVARNETAIKRSLAYIPEQVMLYQHLTAIENLSLLSALAGQRYHADELVQFLEDAGLPTAALTRRVGNFSKGMRQKVGIAAAIAKQAKVLLLDEPTSGLDPKASNEFSEQLVQLAARGTAIFMATHDIFRAREVSSRIGIMRDGHLIDTMPAGQLDAGQLENLYLNYMH